MIEPFIWIGSFFVWLFLYRIACRALGFEQLTSFVTVINTTRHSYEGATILQTEKEIVK